MLFPFIPSHFPHFSLPTFSTTTSPTIAYSSLLLGVLLCSTLCWYVTRKTAGERKGADRGKKQKRSRSNNNNELKRKMRRRKEAENEQKEQKMSRVEEQYRAEIKDEQRSEFKAHSFKNGSGVHNWHTFHPIPTILLHCEIRGVVMTWYFDLITLQVILRRSRPSADWPLFTHRP